MNRKQFIILLVLVAVIGAAGLIIHQRNRQSWQSGGAAIGQKLLPNLAINDVAQITIQSGTNELDLARRDHLWRVRQRAGYPANFSQISALLMKFPDLKVVQTDEVGPSQLGRFDLLPAGAEKNSGTLLAFKDQSGKTLDTLLLGKKHISQPSQNSQMGGMGNEGWPDGRYVMVGTGGKTVDVISDPLDSVEPQPAQWVDKDFLSIEKPRSIAVQFPEATNSWKLTRTSETNDWQLADAQPHEKLDSAKISSVTSPFSSPNFNDVAAASTFNPASNTVVTVQTFDGFNYIANIAPEQNDNYPVKFSITADLPAEPPAPKDEKPADKTKREQAFKAEHAKLAGKLAKEQQFTNWVYQLPAYMVDEILKPRHELLAEETTNSVASVKK